MTDKKNAVKGKNKETNLPFEPDAVKAPDAVQQNQVSENSPENLPTFEELTNKELAKYDAILPKIDELKKELLPLKINGIDDKEGYKLVSEKLRMIVSKRTAVEALRVELNKPSRDYTLKINGRAKEVTELIAPLEEHLRSEKKRIDDEKEEIERQKEIKRQEELSRRHNVLVQAGMSKVGNEYIWQSKVDLTKHECLPDVNLELLSEEDFDAQVLLINSLVESDNKAIEEEKRVEEEKRQKLLQEQEELRKKQQEIQKQQEEEQEKLKKQQEELRLQNEKMQKEIDDMRKMRTDIRLQRLFAIGLWEDTIKTSLYFGEFPHQVKIIDTIQVKDLPIEEWDIKISEIQTQVKDLEEQKVEREKQAAIEKQAKLEELQKEAEEKAKAKIEKEKKDAEEKQKQDEIKRQLEEKQKADAEAERLAGLNDKQKFSEYAAKLIAVQVPEFKTQKWSNEAKKIITALQQYL